MQIAIKTRLGSTALAIKAELIAEKVADAARLAATHIVFHKAGGKARKDGADVVDVVRTALADLFENVEIETSHWDKPDPVLKLAKQMQELGMSEADIAELVAKARTSGKNGEATAEVVEESDEVVG